MLLTLQILGMFTMLTIMFVFIWGFIVLKQVFGQLRYKNYLMEKLIETIYHQNKTGTQTESINNKE